MGSSRKELISRFSVTAFDRLQRSFLPLDGKRAEEKGARLGLFFGRVDKKHRLRTQANLRLAFPDWSEAEVTTTTRKVYEHFGIVLADFLRTPNRTSDELLQSITVEDEAPLNEAVARGKGVLVCGAHFGNWERVGHYATARGFDITSVARDANQSAIQQRVQGLRELTGMKILSRGDSARGVIRVLRAGNLAAMLPDQNDDEVFVPFFGKPAGTVLGPAVLQQRTKCALLPAYCVRVGVEKYHVITRPLINPDHTEADPAVVTAEWMAVLESVIRAYPEQYLWLHDRWKSARVRGML